MHSALYRGEQEASVDRALVMSSRNVALAGGKVRPAFLMTESVRPKLGSSIGRERKEGSARTSRANAGRIAIPKPARTIPTAVIM